MTLASIIVPAYNSARFLPECIESILAQTEQSFQLIIVNDGSTDETLEVAQHYANRDSRITVIDQRNKGVSAARNNGMEVAIGEYILFVDSDDWVTSDLLEKMIKYCQTTNSQVGIAGMFVDFQDANGKLIKSEVSLQEEYVITRGDIGQDKVFNDNFINLLGFTWNKIYRRSLVNQMEFRFEEGLQLFEDVDFNVRVLSKAERVTLIPEAFVHYVQRPVESLVKARRLDHLRVSYQSILNIDRFLEAWGASKDLRDRRKATAAGAALWAVLYATVGNPHPRSLLLQLIDCKEYEYLLSYLTSQPSRSIKSYFAKFVFLRGWYVIGIQLAQMVFNIKKLRYSLLAIVSVIQDKRKW